MSLRSRSPVIVAASLALSLLGSSFASANSEDGRDAEEILDGFDASGSVGAVNLGADGLVTNTVDADANVVEPTPGGGDIGAGGGPYDDFLLGTDNAVLCDATDEDGNAAACPAPVEEIAEEAEDELTLADIQAEVLRVYQSLPVGPSPISYQPDGTWAAVNMDFIVYTDTTAQVLDTTVLGVPVQFRLTPSHWTWDFGDGSPPLPTSQPGQPYPNQTLTHVYSSASDGVTITLSTLWSGEYQVGGSGDWYPVDGYVTTSSTAGPVEIVAFDVRLVPNRND